MPKKGESRSKKFSIKHDPNVIMLRWKALRDFSLKRFYLTPEKHFQLDDEIRTLIDRYLVPYGKAGEFMDFVRKLVYMWEMLSDVQKTYYRQQWIEKGFPVELFDKLTQYYYVLANKVTVYVKNNMVLWFFAELSPIPQEAYAPKEEDYTKILEVEYETYTPKTQDYWFQYAMSIGANIIYFGNVFKGFDADPLLTQLILQTCRSDLGLTLDLFIPAIMRELPEYFIQQFIPDMLYEIQLITPEILRILAFTDPILSYGINEYDLWIYQMIRETVNVFEGITKSYVNSPTLIYTAIVLAPIYGYLTNTPALSYSSDVRKSQILINALPNPTYEVSI